MRDFHEYIYLSELQHQCEFVFISAEMIDTVLKKFLEQMSNDQNSFWFSIQSFLNATGNISKLLFPIYDSKSKIGKIRGAHLRKILDVPHNSILRSRDLRNHFEHYDDRLDTWCNSLKSEIYADRLISMRGDLKMEDNGEVAKHQREYDPDTATLYYQDDEYNVKEIYQEVQKLYQKIVVIKDLHHKGAR